MEARLRSWWQYIRKHRIVAIIIALVIAAIVLIFIESLINGTGFNGYYTTSTTRTISGSLQTITRTEIFQPGKTLWDWLQLLFIPVVLAIAGFWFNHRERKAAELRAENERKAAELHAEAERYIAEDNQREASLQAYINGMSELLLHENLRKSEKGAEVRKIARVQTLTVLPRLDGKRKGRVLQFLYESGLIDNEETIIYLDKADLSGVHLIKVYLEEINLHETNLSKAYLYDLILFGANLSKADLSEANLTRTDLPMANLHQANLFGAELREALLGKADLSEANLQGTDLSKADLRGANLEGATGITIEELEKQSKSLKGATMPDGSLHD